MKVIAINGSPRKDGNTYTALESMRKIKGQNQLYKIKYLTSPYGPTPIRPE